jgi:LPXTG-motif cell wall-anchored protein
MVSKKPRNTLRTIAGGGLAVLVIGGLYFWRKNRTKLE